MSGHVVHAARGQPVALELRIQPLDMPGGELLQTVRADTGNKVVDNVDPVADMGVLRDVRRGGDCSCPLVLSPQQ